MAGPPSVMGSIIYGGQSEATNAVVDVPTQDPFYASTLPQFYALAATTVTSYTLVIMLFITPRSFLQDGVVVLGRRGFTDGGTGGTNIGDRPWLQKLAALTVAISLTIASADTFKLASAQYNSGFQDAENLMIQVLRSLELKVTHIVSETFVWLAQAQTLTRLFPRHREKVIIKYTAFALITFDVIFQCLNSFRYPNQGTPRPRNFTHAVPALSYLFELSLGVLYAAWVIYYALMKKRYAFYHRLMRNMCLLSLLSLLAVLVPVVFFILDMCKPDLTGWGEYVRWVGAAAASVIVWEWVERIEALEREEKKDGILGREVFDGDEMLEITHSDSSWPRKRRRKRKADDDEESGRPWHTDLSFSSGKGNVLSSIATRYRSRSSIRSGDQPGESRTTESSNNDRLRFLQPPLWPARPSPAVTPVSRTDTPSAASTVYAVRFHVLSDTASRSTPPAAGLPVLSRSSSSSSSRHSDDNTTAPTEVPVGGLPRRTSSNRWRALTDRLAFPRAGTGDAPETRRDDEERAHREGSGRWDIKARLEDFAATQAENLRQKIRPPFDTNSLPVMVIPAPARRGTALAQLLEEEEEEEAQTRQTRDPGAQTAGHGSSEVCRSDSAGSRSAPSRDDPSPSHVRRTSTGDSLASRPPMGRSISGESAGAARNTPAISFVPGLAPSSSSSQGRHSPVSPVRPAAPVADGENRASPLPPPSSLPGG